MESTTPNQNRKSKEKLHLSAPKKRKQFESKIFKWKKDRTLSYVVQNYFDQEKDEYIIVTQKFNGQQPAHIILSPEKAEFLVRDITKYLTEYNLNRYKTEMTSVYYQMIREKIFDVRREMCEGCLENYPSQLHHYCLTTDNEKFVEDAFPKLVTDVDEVEANNICNQNLNTNVEIKYPISEILDDNEWVSNLKDKIVNFLNS